MKYLTLFIILLNSFTQGQSDEILTIDSLLNNWHYSAEVSDELTYFNLMDENCIFLGTDKTERWSKNEFIKWSEPYFNKESAWKIKPVRRNIYLSVDSSFVWFDEDLNAAIGECRGSGVLIKSDGNWKLIQYNLALTIPNDIAAGVKKLVDEYNAELNK